MNYGYETEIGTHTHTQTDEHTHRFMFALWPKIHNLDEADSGGFHSRQISQESREAHGETLCVKNLIK